jgi:hypothetical protein
MQNVSPTPAPDPPTPDDTWNYLEVYVAPDNDQADNDQADNDQADNDQADNDQADNDQPDNGQPRGRRLRAAARTLARFGAKWQAAASRVPTPGSLGILLLMLLALVAFLVQVGPGNETRMQLAWDVLRGQKDLPTSVPGVVGVAPSTLDAAGLVILSTLGVPVDSLSEAQQNQLQDILLGVEQQYPTTGNPPSLSQSDYNKVIAQATPLFYQYLVQQNVNVPNPPASSGTNSGGPGGPTSIPQTGQRLVAWEDIPNM